MIAEQSRRGEERRGEEESLARYMSLNSSTSFALVGGAFIVTCGIIGGLVLTKGYSLRLAF